MKRWIAALVWLVPAWGLAFAQQATVDEVEASLATSLALAREAVEAVNDFQQGGPVETVVDGVFVCGSAVGAKPLSDALAEAVTELEGGYAGLGAATGMAAISTVFLTYLQSGDHVVADVGEMEENGQGLVFRKPEPATEESPQEMVEAET
mgnify:CR=1 FL=1